MQAPPRSLVVLAGIAGLQGVALLGYAVFDIVEAVRVGITGPAEVSNPMALLLVIVLTALFGAALVWVALGWWRARSWARAPFIVAQLIVGLLGYEVAQSQGSVESAVGWTAVAIAVLGLVLALVPATSRALEE